MKAVVCASALGLLVILAGCGGSAGPASTPTSSASASATSSPPACTASGHASPSWPPAASISASPAPIVSAVTAGDTLTLTFSQGTPEFQVIPQPSSHFFVGDGQGNTVDMAGSAGAIIVLRGFRGDMLNYAGPADITANGALLLEVRHVNEFEGSVHWAVGLSKPGCANVTGDSSTLRFHFIPSSG